MSNPANGCAIASHRVRNLSFHGLITYLLLPKHTRYTPAHTSTQKLTAKPSNPLHVQHILHFSPPFFKQPCTIQKCCTQVTRSGWTSRLLPRAVGKRRRGEKRKKKRKTEMIEGRPTITVCFLACWGLQPNLLHLLWRLNLAGERYVGGGLGGDLGWHLYSGPQPASKKPGLDTTQ